MINLLSEGLEMKFVARLRRVLEIFGKTFDEIKENLMRKSEMKNFLRNSEEKIFLENLRNFF